MESLESKLDRLSPEQRKEVEDFVEFLLSRSGLMSTLPKSPLDPPPVLNISASPPPLFEPVPAEEIHPPVFQNHTRDENGASGESGDAAAPAPFHEIGGGIQDNRIHHDYMDYGQFESPPSLATEAVKKVGRKIIAREGEEKPRHLLDWVD
jgi:hypothetical protein